MLTHSEIADKFSTAYPAADLETVREIFHPDATIWHNFDSCAQPLNENLAVIAAVAQSHTVEYVDIRRHYFDGGLVQQHQVRGDSTTDQPWSAEACLVFYVTNGLVSRLEVYLDPAQLPS